MARQLRDAQCHTIWEGTENICCLDVRRAIRATPRTRRCSRASSGRCESASPAKGLAFAVDTVALALDDARAAIDHLATAPTDIQLLEARRLAFLLADPSRPRCCSTKPRGRSSEHDDARKGRDRAYGSRGERLAAFRARPPRLRPHRARPLRHRRPLRRPRAGRRVRVATTVWRIVAGAGRRARRAARPAGRQLRQRHPDLAHRQRSRRRRRSSGGCTRWRDTGRPTGVSHYDLWDEVIGAARRRAPIPTSLPLGTERAPARVAVGRARVLRRRTATISSPRRSPRPPPTRSGARPTPSASSTTSASAPRGSRPAARCRSSRCVFAELASPRAPLTG